MRNNGILYSVDKKKTHILNAQFKSMFTDVGINNIQHHNVITNNAVMPDIHVTSPCVLNLLQNLKIHKASGPDNVSARILNNLSEQLAPMLTKLFNICLSRGETLSDWRYALVSPIYKKWRQTFANKLSPGITYMYHL